MSQTDPSPEGTASVRTLLVVLVALWVGLVLWVVRHGERLGDGSADAIVVARGDLPVAPSAAPPDDATANGGATGASAGTDRIDDPAASDAPDPDGVAGGEPGRASEAEPTPGAGGRASGPAPSASLGASRVEALAEELARARGRVDDERPMPPAAPSGPDGSTGTRPAPPTIGADRAAEPPASGRGSARGGPSSLRPPAGSATGRSADGGARLSTGPSGSEQASRARAGRASSNAAADGRVADDAVAPGGGTADASPERDASAGDGANGDGIGAGEPVVRVPGPDGRAAGRERAAGGGTDGGAGTDANGADDVETEEPADTDANGADGVGTEEPIDTHANGEGDVETEEPADTDANGEVGDGGGRGAVDGDAGAGTDDAVDRGGDGRGSPRSQSGGGDPDATAVTGDGANADVADDGADVGAGGADETDDTPVADGPDTDDGAGTGEGRAGASGERESAEGAVDTAAEAGETDAEEGPREPPSESPFEIRRREELAALAELAAEVRFERARATFDAEHREPLERVFEILFLYPDTLVEIAVESRDTGDAETDRRLDAERGRAIVDYLVSRGLARTRFAVEIGDGRGLPVGEHRVRVRVEDAER